MPSLIWPVKWITKTATWNITVSSFHLFEGYFYYWHISSKTEDFFDTMAAKTEVLEFHYLVIYMLQSSEMERGCLHKFKATLENCKSPLFFLLCCLLYTSWSEGLNGCCQLHFDKHCMGLRMNIHRLNVLFNIWPVSASFHISNIMYLNKMAAFVVRLQRFTRYHVTKIKIQIMYSSRIAL